MGYDLRLVGTITPVEVTVEEHGRWFDGERVFSVNGGGMEKLLDAMDEREMLASVDMPEPPELEDFGLSCPIPWPWSEETEDPALIAYWEAGDAWRSVEFDEPGIPIFKLTSNEDWYVSAAEARSALHMLGSQDQPHDRLWKTWMLFLQTAAEHDGFFVT